uniref:Dual specificity protein phosphatase n=1 Tax=Oryzias sinensis TaxID=183150 RepID=A0A8C7Y6N3_9TELE
MQLCTQHWHGLISAPVNLKVPLWSSGFSTALEARDRLMDIIKDKLENDTEGFPATLSSLPLPDSSAAAQHLLLFISALIPKALASLLTSFTLVLSADEQVESRRRAVEDSDFLHTVLLEVQRLWPPFIGGRRIADQDTTLAGFDIPKAYGAIFISHSVHRDPEVFQQPDSFLPERWSGRNAGQESFLCSFGNGPRSCIGSKLTDIFLKGGPVEILPFLYLGSALHASKKEVLDAIGISALLNVSADCPNHFEGAYQYKCIPVEDNHKEDISCWFLEAIEFIDSVRDSSGRVLVHCQAGISRSATICLAYLMKRKRIRLDEAFEFVRRRRSIISPNFSFMGQLLQFESQVLATSCAAEAAATASPLLGPKSTAATNSTTATPTSPFIFNFPVSVVNPAYLHHSPITTSPGC